MIKRLFALLLFLLPQLVQGQTYSMQFTRITTKQGLSQSWVRSIYQDDLGYLWFGTRDGINRYDGENIKVFTADDHEHPGLGHSSINFIAPKGGSELWICTDKGVSVYNRATNSFTRFAHLSYHSVGTCLTDRNGFIWFGTYSGLYRYNPTNDSITPFAHNPASSSSLSHNSIRCLFLDSHGNLWVGTHNGLNLFVPESETFIRYLTSRKSGSISGSDVRALVQDGKGRLWVGSDAGLDIFENHNERPTEGRFRRVLQGSLNQLLADSKNRLWVGKDGGEGLLILDLNSVDSPSGVSYSEHLHAPQIPWSLSDNSVASLFEDRYGDIWVGTFGGGVNFTSPRKKQFHNYNVTADPKKSISGQLVNALFEDDQYLWVGTEMGLDRLDKKTHEFINFPLSRNRTNNPQVNSIYSIQKDSRGNLWVGTWAEGLNLYNYKTQTFKSFLPDGKPGSINSFNVISILEDSKGNLWIGTNGGGLNKFNYSTQTFTHYTHDPNDPQSIANNSVNCIYETSDGTLLLTVYHSLEVFDPSNGTFTSFVNDPNDPKSITAGSTLSIFEDSRKNIWVATNMGLNLFHKELGTFTRYTREHGLPNNTIQAILEDHRGNLWISTNRGLAKFINGANTPMVPNFRLYDERDGLPSNEFTARAALKDSRGWLMFGTSQGFTAFHPDSIFENTVPPKVLLTDFSLILSSPRKPEFSLPTKDINNIGTIRLKHTQNSFTIGFTALNFLSPDKNQYKFMLEGYETHWRNVGTMNLATYTNISPGTYTFMVHGSNNDGVWSTEPSSLKIVIAPPWWETLAFRILLVLSLTVAILMFIRVRLRLLERQKQNLELSVKERTNELSMANLLLGDKQKEISRQNEELTQHRHHLEKLIYERTEELEVAKNRAENSDKLKTAFLANMSHEIRTPMNAIVGFSNLLAKPNLSDFERQRYTEIINANSESLLVLINDILDIALIEANEIVFEKKWFAPKGILEELEQYFQLKNSKGLEIKFILHEDETDLNLYSDPVRFRQIISNLISNAYKYTDTGHIHFGYQIVDGSAQFYVADTGVGIDRKEFSNIFNHFYKIEHHETKLYRGTGIGLSISRKLVENLGGTIWLESKVGLGSIFFFALPLDSPEKERIEKNKIKPTSKAKASDINLSLSTIVVAEDEPTNFMLLDRLLSDAGARVVWAKDGAQAVDFIRTHLPIERCVVLMDIKMPIMDGFQACILIKELDSTIPILAVTAYAQAQDEVRIMGAQFDDYIPKPIRAKHLLQTVSKWVGGNG